MSDFKKEVLCSVCRKEVKDKRRLNLIFINGGFAEVCLDCFEENLHNHQKPSANNNKRDFCTFDFTKSKKRRK
jgi:hypothetical protein